jgi:hypothetical protein
MNAEAWYKSTKPSQLLRIALKQNQSPRKTQLLLCGICRLVEDWLPTQTMRDLIGVTEQFVDGTIPFAEFEQQRNAAQLHEQQQSLPAQCAVLILSAAVSYDLDVSIDRIFHVVEGLWKNRWELEWPDGKTTRDARQFCELIQELYPPPAAQYQQQPNFAGGGLLLPDGTTFQIPENARLIAKGIQHDHAFDRLPILADALEDANLTDRPLLDHLRHGTGHRQGCWALDIIRGIR